jgi:hypothetical protein
MGGRYTGQEGMKKDEIEMEGCGFVYGDVEK